MNFSLIKSIMLTRLVAQQTPKAVVAAATGQKMFYLQCSYSQLQRSFYEWCTTRFTWYGNTVRMDERRSFYKWCTTRFTWYGNTVRMDERRSFYRWCTTRFTWYGNTVRMDERRSFYRWCTTRFTWYGNTVRMDERRSFYEMVYHQVHLVRQYSQDG